MTMAAIRDSAPDPAAGAPVPGMPVRTDLADAMALPLFVDQLAESLWRYAGESLDVVDLAPGTGVLAARLLRALDRRAAAGERTPDLRIYLCGGDKASLLRHPRLRVGWRRGEVRLHAWDPADTGDAPPLRERVAFLAMGYFQALPVQICAAHFTEWYVARTEVSSRDDDVDRALRHHWEQANDAGPLAGFYRRKLGSVALNLPHAALRAVRTMASRSAGRYLLIAADHGASSLADIADGYLVAPATWRDGTSAMPVNFHALTLAQAGATVAHCRTGCDTPVLHMAMAGDDAGPLFARVAEPLRQGLDTALSLREQARWTSADAPLSFRLALLRQSACDPHAVAVPHIDTPPGMATRAAWRDALERAWEFACDEDPAHAGSWLGACAAGLGLWGLATRILGGPGHTRDTGDVDLLSWSLLHIGEVDAACTLLGRTADDAAEWKTYLRELQRYRRSLPWFTPDGAVDGEIRLEPLAGHHAVECFRQYRDAHIGVMTRLPDMDSVEATGAWIAAQQADASRACFAVVDRELGFVGSAGYQHAGDAGYFHFWIGADHQNRGLGRRAARLLERQARIAGIRVLYTSVYRDNPRSLAALSQLGFARLEARAPAPDDELLFFHRTLDPAVAVSVDALRLLCRAIGCPFEPVPCATSPASRIPVSR